MKKIISILLIMVLALSLFACGTKTDEGAASPSASPSEEASASPSETPASESPEAEDDLAYIIEKGKLVIGITPYEPMNYKDENGKLTGFDTEFAEAVCAKLGVTPEFVFINWDTKEIELASKKIDCIWNGLTVTEERKANMDFSKSYIINAQVVVIRAEDAEKYTDLASLAGAAIDAEGGSAGEAAIQKDLATATYTAVAKQADALLEVKSGIADAAVIDATMADSMTGEGSDYSDLMVVSTIDLMDEEYAIGFRVGSTATDKVNEIMDALLKDGTLMNIAAKYEGLSERLIQD
jgi:polar amino acid transport system substrate-binding protein